jgi:hypothetical protein
MCKGILFKFALDAELKKGLWMYGDDTADDSCALKAGTRLSYGVLHTPDPNVRERNGQLVTSCEA